MSLLNWRVEAATDTTVSFWLESDTNESIDVIIDGDTYSIQTNGDNNTGYDTATGLTAGTTYTYTVDGSISGTVRTLPAFGEDTTITWTHCKSPLITNELIPVVQAQNPDLHIYGGDTPYTDYGNIGALRAYNITVNGRTVVSSDRDPSGGEPYSTGVPTRDQMRQHNLSFLMDPTQKILNRSVPNFYVMDDHEMPGNNWDHTWFPMQDSWSAPHLNTQTKRDQAWQASNQGWRDIHPTLPWAETNTANYDKPSGGGTDNGGVLTATDYEPNYYKVRSGCVDIYFLDCVTGKSPNDATDDTNKLLIGANQLTWLKNDLIANKDNPYVVFRLIVSSKPITHDQVEDTLDGWSSRQTQLDEILTWRDSENITGMFWIGGDSHQSRYTNQLSTDSPFFQDIAGIIGGSTSAKGYNTGGSTIGSYAWDLPYMVDDPYNHRSCVVINANKKKATVRVIDSQERELFIGTILPDSNTWDTISYPYGRQDQITG